MAEQMSNNVINNELPETNSNYEKIQFFQNEFCLALCNREWDCFTKTQYTELRKKIGFALFGVPEEERTENDQTDNINYTYSKKQEEQIQKIYEAIINFGCYSRIPGVIYMSTIFVFGEELKKTNDGEIFQTPIFRIRKCHKRYDNYEYFIQFYYLQTYGYSVFEKSADYCQIFIDDEARVYNSWQNYLKENRLQKCCMYFPKNGIYQIKITNLEKEEYMADIEICLSPRCSIVKELTNTADVVGTVGGIGSMVICGAAAISAITVAPVVLAGASIVGLTTGIYAASRSIIGLRDRKIHKQEIGLKDAESRKHWFNIVGGIAVGSATGPTHQILGNVAEKTATLGMAGQIAFSGANLLTKGAGVLNSLHLFEEKQEINDDDWKTKIFQFIYSLLFFEHATWDIKIVNSCINESQKKMLEDYEKRLRAKRKRKTFMKALKEVDKTTNNEIVTTEIVYGLRKMENSNNICEMLIQSKKLFDNDEILINNVNEQHNIRSALIESSQFSSIPLISDCIIIENLSNLTEDNLHINTIEKKPNFQLSDNDILDMNISIEKISLNNEKVLGTIDEILEIFNLTTQQCLREIMVYFFYKIQDINDQVERTYPNTSSLITILQFICHYLEKYIEIHQMNKNLNFETIIYRNNIKQPILINENMINLYEYLIKCLNKKIIDQIIFSFRIWLEQQINKFWDEYNMTIEQIEKMQENRCKTCNGIYYNTLN